MKRFGTSLLAVLLWASTPAASEEPPRLPAGTLVFHEKVQGQMEVFVSSDGGATATNVSRHPSEDSAPALSPDGQRIAFQSGRAGKSHIFTVPVSGGAPSQVTTGGSLDQSPCWSPDGRTIYFESHRGEGWRLCAVAATGGPVRVVSGQDVEALSPACSADGKRLACQLRRRGTERWLIAVLDLQGKMLWESSAGLSEFNESPAFSPDGRWVYFASSAPDGYQIFRVDSSGQAQAQAVTRFPGWKMHPATVAEGAWLLFDEKTPAGWRLGLADPATGAHSTLSSSGDRFHPGWRDAGK
ncbi:MAG: PD40 domain-containing protein [Candidatus Wallbacteria bacterium]|nr:PD40 domain-containing protein [Candidatus Wallbacteria bacterium]